MGGVMAALHEGLPAAAGPLGRVRFPLRQAHQTAVFRYYPATKPLQLGSCNPLEERPARPSRPGRNAGSTQRFPAQQKAEAGGDK